MRSRTTCKNDRAEPRSVAKSSGFLMGEALVAISLAALLMASAIVLSVTMEELHATAVMQLEKIKRASGEIATSSSSVRKYFGDDTEEIFLEQLTLLKSNFSKAWGGTSCNPRLTLTQEQVRLISPPLYLGAGNRSTDIEVRNGLAYIAADSSVASAHDLFIIDLNDPEDPRIISSISTGPGLSALDVAGPYIYAANLGTTHQLQVIDITDRSVPIVVATLKLPPPQASSTPPYATSIFYSEGHVYLGTEKWEGNEFSVIDVATPGSPRYEGGFKTDTQVNSIYIRDDLAYVAASDRGQMRILDVSNPASIFQVSDFSPSGWETQIGKIVSYFEGEASLGRTTGGFNQVNNHELFLFSSSSDLSASRDVPGGVYGIIRRPGGIFLATRQPTREFQLWKKDLSEKIMEYPLGFSPAAMSCDRNTLYFATGNERGAAVLRIN